MTHCSTCFHFLMLSSLSMWAEFILCGYISWTKYQITNTRKKRWWSKEKTYTDTIPNDWHNFLKNRESKMQLIMFHLKNVKSVEFPHNVTQILQKSWKWVCHGIFSVPMIICVNINLEQYASIFCDFKSGKSQILV